MIFLLVIQRHPEQRQRAAIAGPCFQLGPKDCFGSRKIAALQGRQRFPNAGGYVRRETAMATTSKTTEIGVAFGTWKRHSVFYASRDGAVQSGFAAQHSR